MDNEGCKSRGQLLYLRQQEDHIVGNIEYGTIALNVVVADFEGSLHMILVGVIDNGAQRFCIAIFGLAFYGRAFGFITDDEIQFESTVFVIIVKFASHLAKYVRQEIFEYGTFVGKQVAL